GAALGAAAGLLAARRLPEAAAAWIGWGAVYGATLAGTGLGAALVAAGARIPQWISTAVGLALVGWSVADVLGHLPASPGAVVGHIGVAPLGVSAIEVAAPVVVALGLVAFGLWR